MTPIHSVHSHPPQPTDRLVLLQALLLLAETKSTSLTAQRLGLSQPTISRMLQRLELLAGTRLVRRSSRGVLLTSEGDLLLQPARDLLQGWDTLMRTVQKGQETFSGFIRIAAPVAIGQNMLAILVSRFLLQHPGVSVEMDLRDDAIDLFKTKYDVWLRAGATPDNLVVQDIYRARRLLVAAPGTAPATHPCDLVHAKAVRLQTFVPRTIALTHSSGERFSLAQKVAFTSDHLEAVRMAALQGVGYAVLPLWAVKDDLEAGRFVRLCPGWEPPAVKFCIAFPPDPKRPARVGGLIRFLREELSRPNGFGVVYLRQAGIADTVQVLP